MRNLIFIVLIPFFLGCASHIHKRPITNSRGEFVGVEETRWRFFGMDSKASKVSVETKDLNYSRKVNANEAEQSSDEELIGKITSGVAAGIASALK